MTDSPITASGDTTRLPDDSRSISGPRLLCDTRVLTALAAAPAGELWSLPAHGRELDAGITHLLPGQRLNTHTDEERDVLLLILAGDATVPTPHGPQRLTEGTLLWLPRGTTAGLTAGESGLSCLTVRRHSPAATTLHAQQSTPRQPPGASSAPPGATRQHEWPKWLC